VSAAPVFLRRLVCAAYHDVSLRAAGAIAALTTQQVMRNGLGLLGVSAPESM
jgi:arginyl-tRNA synthetase